jgi:uncharacterized protein
MTVELRPLGVLCNIACRYCYQDPQRKCESAKNLYNIDVMKNVLEREGGGPFSLFGGEPLLVPDQDLEELWSWGYRQFGSNTVQTNGTTIRDSHIRMFKEYGVRVGISIDGPGELNDLRWAGSLAATRNATAKTEAAIERLCANGVIPSVIITLHRVNAHASKLSTMDGWLRRLDVLGVRHARLHIMESESTSIRDAYSLSAREYREAFLHFAGLEPTFTQLRFDVFSDMRKMLLGHDDATCIWLGCDPYTTSSVLGIEGQGQLSNCGRTNKDGVNFVKGDLRGYERYLALYHTPQNYGGCAGCKFFLMCKGQCPGTAIDGDWRNRSEHCEVWKGLYEFFEQELIASDQMPISISPIRKYLEEQMLEAWITGNNPKLENLLEGCNLSATPTTIAPNNSQA